jgi:hypothetical protein
LNGRGGKGRILAGRHEGATLDALDVATVVGFLPEIDEEILRHHQAG